MDKTLWYANGLRFQCSQCGNCCTGSPGFVWVNQQEIEALAGAIGEEFDAFDDKYVRKIGIRKSLREFPNGDCVFFDTAARSCSVYDFRPRQCRTWPFWDSNLRKPEDWVSACEKCPGSGTGRLYQLEEIERDRQVMRI
ncbi:MAG: YkgJ family cysteine cluster protein [Planctomycetota bacterium]|nr:YkgJ family cysteine cluster protein [Planctomycetota bacterium]